MVLWPAAEFEKYAARLNEASRADASVRSYLRVLFSGCVRPGPGQAGDGSDCPPRCGTTPPLDRDVVIAGNGTTAEIWDVLAWDAYLAVQEQSFSELGEEVVLGLF